MNFFDLHTDTPLVLDSNNPEASVLDFKNHPFEVYNQAMAVFLRENENNPFESYKRRVALVKKHLKSQNFALNKSIVKGVSSAFLTVENAAFLAEDIGRLYTLKNDGVLALSLTWNGDNLLASGADGEGGITPLGKEVINQMNALNIALDISHLSHKAAMEAICLADKVLATHSAVFKLNPHKRNLKDEHLLAIKQKQGIVGLCFYPLFLGGEDVFKRLLESVRYLISMGMEQNIAFGSDFDGAKMAPCLCCSKHISNLFNAFCDSGLKKSTVNRIFYENAIAFFGKICENK